MCVIIPVYVYIVTVTVLFLSEFNFRYFKFMFLYFNVNVSYFSQRHSAVMTLFVILLVVNTLPLYRCNPASVLQYLINHS